LHRLLMNPLVIIHPRGFGIAKILILIVRVYLQENIQRPAKCQKRVLYHA
jgi:hypothetical protein